MSQLWNAGWISAHYTKSQSWNSGWILAHYTPSQPWNPGWISAHYVTTLKRRLYFSTLHAVTTLKRMLNFSTLHAVTALNFSTLHGVTALKTQAEFQHATQHHNFKENSIFLSFKFFVLRSRTASKTLEPLDASTAPTAHHPVPGFSLYRATLGRRTRIYEY
jgi:hypothetical protein